MWNDEDNNPYGSFDRRDSSDNAHASQHGARKPCVLVLGHTLLIVPPEIGFERASTPTSGNSSPVNEPSEFVSRPRDLSDDDEEDYGQQNSGASLKKKGGYDSRIEQILYENPDLQIIITDAGKSHESGGSYIVYTIRTGVRLPVACSRKLC